MLIMKLDGSSGQLVAMKIGSATHKSGPKIPDMSQ